MHSYSNAIDYHGDSWMLVFISVGYQTLTTYHKLFQSSLKCVSNNCNYIAVEPLPYRKQINLFKSDV